MTSGIYAYWDNVNSYYVYVGKDSNIDKKNRHYKHVAKYNYDEQPINRVLQNNPERYEYRIIMKGDYNDWELNQMEKLCIKSFKTFKRDYPERNVFNFTRGGDGISGWKHSPEARKKMSESHTDMSGGNNPFYGQKHTLESRKKMSEAHIGKTLTEEHKKTISKSLTGITRSEETKKKMSESQSKYKIWDTSAVHYHKGTMFSYNGGNKPRKAFKLKFNKKDILIGGFIDFTTPEIIHDLICEAIGDYNG